LAGIAAGLSGGWAGTMLGSATGSRDDRPRTVRLSTDERGVVSAGQWKLRWSGRHIEIDQIPDVGPMARRSARLEFAPDGTPVRMVQMVHRAFGPFVISAYRPWKEPC
jgi:hypothetical protein